MSDSESDKKRNKLGYQRISIACAHCRRRKIRCLVAEGDPQQRCQNCIRLKKECVFYPVDQQSAMENKSQPSVQSGADSGPSSVVSSSPPQSGSERPFEQPHGASPFQVVPSSAETPFQHMPLEAGNPLPVQGGFSTQHQGLRPPGDPRMAWNAAEQYGQDQMPMLTSAPQEFWRYNTVRAPVDFAPFPSGSPQASQHPRYEPHSPFPEHRDSHQWPPPQQPLRSMSYGHIEQGMRSSDAVFPFQQDFHAQSNPLHHPPSSLGVHTPMMTQHTGPQSAPVRGPYGQPTAYGFSPDQQSSQHVFPPHPTYPATWYPGHPSFEPLEEEPDSMDFTGGRHPQRQ